LLKKGSNERTADYFLFARLRGRGEAEPGRVRFLEQSRDTSNISNEAQLHGEMSEEEE